MRSSDQSAPTRRGWVPTFVFAFALVFVLVWGLRGILNVVGASPGLQTGLFNVFRVLVAVGDVLALLGGLALVVRPWLLSSPRAGPVWLLRLAGVAIVLVGGLGTAATWLNGTVFSLAAVANPPPLLGFLATSGPLLSIPAYLLLLGFVLRGAGGPRAGKANGD
jgi:hypothetical protein